MVGRVVSVKMLKTAVVLVESRKRHPIYKKSFLQTKKYLVDDPFGVKLGDIVVFVKVKPLSLRKHHLITQVLGTDFVNLEQAQLQEKVEEAIAEVMPTSEKDESGQIESKSRKNNKAIDEVLDDGDEKDIKGRKTK